MVTDGNYYINSMFNNFLCRQITPMKNHRELANYDYHLLDSNRVFLLAVGCALNVSIDPKPVH